jgi:hypothetical protein
MKSDLCNFSDEDGEIVDYITHGDMVFPAILPLSFCKKTGEQLFALPGGGRATKAWIKSNLSPFVKTHLKR